MVRILLERSFNRPTANLQTADYLSQGKHRGATGDRGEADADFSKTLAPAGSSAPPLLGPPRPGRVRRGSDRT